MYKYKVGDKVVVIFPWAYEIEAYRYGSVGKIISTSSDLSLYRLDDNVVYGEDQIVPEEIYNSPLYQALKEP